MSEATGTAQAQNTVVTEEALLKSIKALETKIETPAEPAAPVVQTEALIKSAKDTIAEKASPALQQALDVSGTLKEFAGLMGMHVDLSLGSLQKSIQAGAARDLAIVTVLQDLKKSIDANTDAIKAYGNQPAASAPQTVTVAATEVLQKSATGTTKPAETDPAQVRKQLVVGFEALAKSAPTGSMEQNRWIQAAVKLESAGKVDDADALQAMKAYKNLAKA